MKHLIFTACIGIATANVAAAQAPPVGLMKCDAPTTVLGTIQLPQRVLADGKPLAPGSYQVRLTTDRPTPAVGQSASAECWVEFMKDGAVAGREIATVVANDDIGAIAKGPGPKPDGSRVDVLKGGEYVRAWINHASVHYIVNMPIAGQ
jgi:hypothetical protein